ncbi:thioredoxin reductase [Plasmodium ovale curtisi]|uniref:Thioredoxin reductase n=1 Tax=Plasmodium ovale curtisi TaxID=864141 RepID=A0A1A8VZQ1_PLAOA|nr:thioredoxin reductase [Plasmodium ovale curtisi]
MNNALASLKSFPSKYLQIAQHHFTRNICRIFCESNVCFTGDIIENIVLYNIHNVSYKAFFHKIIVPDRRKIAQGKKKGELVISEQIMCGEKNEKKNYEQANTNGENTSKDPQIGVNTGIEQEQCSHFDYDYIVIGGGPGGMASAKEAAAHGAKVLLLDFVKPSSQGTKWGIGGTCVNVGCVPKKLMHYAGNMGSLFKLDSGEYGWKYDNLKHDWTKLVTTVQSHIRSLNFSYMTGLRSAKVKYINGLAKLKGKNVVSYYLKGDISKEEVVTGKYILISTGCRPHIPEDVEGAKELSITSDDIFSLKKEPGKTLVVGASYVALECAGFLNSLGYDVTVAVRSIVLRGFDQQCANKVKNYMEEQGVVFMNGILPIKLTKENEKISVRFSNNITEQFDTVLYATGRKGDTSYLNLESVNVHINKSNHKIVADKYSCTNIPTIYAVGDVAENIPELAPVAIKAGEILARRLFKKSNEIMDYTFIPTSIYTPIEYGACGYSEEKAYELYGKSNVEIFLQEFNNLEISAVHRKKCMKVQKDEYDVDISSTCLAKLVCLKNEDYQVVGFHYVGPNAGEVTQGMALALKLNVKKKDFDNCIGIHPTDAESFMNLFVTLSSGMSYAAKGGCGGGKCG